MRFSRGGSKHVLLDDSGNPTTDWLVNVVFYDAYDRPLQTQSNNHLHLAVADKTTMQYDYTRPRFTKTTHHQNDTTAITLTDRPEYDHAGRVVRLYRKINGGDEQLLVQYEHNELGQVTGKKIHDKGNDTWLQEVDFAYTIRGWLKQINDPANIGDDFFAQELVYNDSLGALDQAPAWNGNITAVKWKENFGSGASPAMKAYAYKYALNDQLKEAKFGAGASLNQQVDRFNEQNITYDGNGNILTLQRKGKDNTGATATIDNLSYTYDSNKLTKVTDSGTPLGFNDGANQATEYAYTESGSLASDKNKGIDTVLYNVLGKVQRVEFANGRKIKYTYDAAGVKLAMQEYEGDSLIKTTRYAGGFLYENDTLKFFSSPEGRTVVHNGEFEYQYALADHQGNTRVVFTSKVDTLVYTATFETTGSGLREDTDLFENVGGVNEVNSEAANATAGGGRAIRLNKDYKAGPGIMLRVYPGDKIDAQAMAYYEAGTGYNTSATLATMITAIAGIFGGQSGAGGESGAIYNNFNDALTALGLGGNQGDTIPSAWLNYIFFDEIDGVDFENQEDNAGWERVPTTARMNNALVALNIPVIKVPGYLYIYLSYENESQNWVYFDDLKVTYKKSQVVQSNNYYAFGMQTSESWTRTDTQPNKYLYNAGSEQNTATGNYEMFFREYDPALGRMNAVDPMASKYASLTPYNYAFNTPVTLNDPTGADPYYQDVPGYQHYPYWQGYVNGQYYVTDNLPQRDRGQWVGSGVNNNAVYGRLNLPNLGGGWVLRLGALTIDYNSLEDGIHNFGFSDGGVTSYSYSKYEPSSTGGIWIALGDNGAIVKYVGKNKVNDADGNLYKGEFARYNRKGKPRYSGFLGETMSTLRILERTRIGALLLNILQNSTNQSIIAKGPNHFNPGELGPIRENFHCLANNACAISIFNTGKLIMPNYSFDKIGSGGVSYWTPTNDILLNAVNLGHELFHGYDANFGIMDRSFLKDLEVTQWRAIYFENLLRKELSMPYREYDGSVSVLDRGRPIYVPPPTIFWLKNFEILNLNGQ